MPYFSELSKERLWSCDERLRDICNKAIMIYDFSVVCGHRDKKEQNNAFKTGKTSLKYPESKHNTSPSRAVDIVPWNKKTKSVDWENIRSFHILAGIMFAVAHAKGVKLRWGGDWDSDWDIKDQNWFDLGHFELKD